MLCRLFTLGSVLIRTILIGSVGLRAFSVDAMLGVLDPPPPLPPRISVLNIFDAPLKLFVDEWQPNGGEWG